MKELIAEAFRTTLVTEVSSYHLYRNASASVAEKRGREFFERLAREQGRVIEEIMSKRPEGVETGMEEQAEGECPPSRQSLFNHLRIALLHRDACIDRYRTFVGSFREPVICGVFQMALDVARAQHRLIAREYRRTDQKVGHPRADRRSKRTHLKMTNRPAPNKHSQLYHSLQDSGSRLPL